ncbi:hypothetical protein AAVH_08956 [Aphelenchoides avenae]|nr:hypothetical protein AAVH_08956 [Aphelenchus avenae]
MNIQTSTGPTYFITGNANINLIGSQQNMSTCVTQEAVGESRNPHTSTGPTFVIGGNANINMIGSQQIMSRDPLTPAPTIIVNGIINNGQMGTQQN